MRKIFGSRSNKEQINDLTLEIERLKSELAKAESLVIELQAKSRSLNSSPRLAGNESDDHPVILPTNGWDNEPE